MMLENGARRACIYFIYDHDGVIDNYIIYQLNDMRQNVNFLHCVINGNLKPEGRLLLDQICDEVYMRENRGRDIGAYQAAIRYIGWKKLELFDELVLMNNTCFGPVYPFREVFDWAMKQDLDFWGLTWGQKIDWLDGAEYLHYNSRKTHIQSYFIVIRKPLLGSKLLCDFFEDMPEDADYGTSGSVYEYAFPGYFEERNYRGNVYCDIIDDYNYPLLHDPIRLLRDYRMPLFKKRSFFHHYTDVLGNTAGEATARLIRFLKEETDYDMNLVWESILRTCSLSDLVRCAQLNRILPSTFVSQNSLVSFLKVGLVFHTYYDDLFDENIFYIKNFPKGTGIFITTDTEEKRKTFEKKLVDAGLNAEVVVIENRGRDVSSLLVGAVDFIKNYDLICFAHDKKTLQICPHSVGRSWAYKLHENVFGSKDFVVNVIHMFEKEERLGIAFPAYPNHGIYSDNIGTGWTGNFENTQELLRHFGINVNINVNTLCVAPLGTCFWFRTAAIKKLFSGLEGQGWSYTDFPKEPNRLDHTLLHAIERSYAYFAQDAGYYPVFLYSDRYAEIELTNLEFEKTGSTEMRIWVDILTQDAIGHRKIEDVFQKPLDKVSRTDILMYSNQHTNYGVRKSLLHLAYALRCKYPKLWSIILPIRRIGQKVLGIKTR